VVEEENDQVMSSGSNFIVSHPTGNTFVRALLEELQKNQQLEKFYTTIGVGLGRNPFSQSIKSKKRLCYSRR
jgi:hypothetical protein